MTTPDGMPISEVARRSGVSQSCLRYYENIGLLPQPPRRSGQRRYTESTLDLLVLVEAGRRAGGSLADVGQLIRSVTSGTTVEAAWNAVTGRLLTQVEDRIRELEATRDLVEALQGCRCADISECVSRLGRAARPSTSRRATRPLGGDVAAQRR